MDDISEGLSQKEVFGCSSDPHTVIKKKKKKSLQISGAWGSICYLFIVFSKRLSKMFLVGWLSQTLTVYPSSLLLNRLSLPLHI